MNAVTTSQPHALQVGDPNPMDRNPAAVHVAGFSVGSRRTNGQAGALGVDCVSSASHSSHGGDPFVVGKALRARDGQQDVISIARGD
ncbi:MAG TPA: hypothetical protein VJ020_10045 [Anaerolineales bacterium]|nr:hypothetical protein [Anaerolineales bacterium]